MTVPAFHVMLNATSGTAMAGNVTADELLRRFSELGHSVSIDADSSRPFAQRLQTSRNSPATVLVAAGGDGTATALAAIAAETGKRLVVLPLGTANLLARDLRLPLTLDAWFAGLPEMIEQDVDIGEVNGHVFLHKVVIGAVPGIAAVREKIRGNSSIAARFAFASHFVRQLNTFRRFAVEVIAENGAPYIHRVHSIAVVNNDYDEGLGKLFHRSRLDAGYLSLYIIRSLSVMNAVRLSFEMLLGAWRSDDVLEVENVETVSIRTRRRRIRVMMDGEVRLLAGPLVFRIRPKALKVLAGPLPVEAQEPELAPA